jgi:ubiquinone biosynthesis O-methyltransferase
MNKVREFQKYKTRGAYHWEQISLNPRKRNSFVLGRYQNMFQLVQKEIDIKNKKLLDIGCGDGVLSYLFAKEGAKVTGIDYSDIAIEFGKEKIKSKNLDIDFKQGSAYELPYKDNSFDIIVSSDVIEHLEDVPKYLSEINRVVKNGGIVVISTPIKFTEYPLDKEHVIEWFPNEFKQVIEKQFNKTQYSYSHPLTLEQIYQTTYFGKQLSKILFNIVSLFKNPFVGFNSKFQYLMLQYSVSKVL